MSGILPNEVIAALEADEEVSPELKRLVLRARKASDFLKALAHESRLLILCLLAEKERSAGELENLLSINQPTVSQQLARLRLDGLVQARREGKAVIYSLPDETTRRFIGAIYDKFCREEPSRKR
ncbi:MAG: winged helix-turn-helix transcriptional regulator [Hyphomicrobium denitrificans]|jgi:DNA-binding transcriptional ArsR family regulator|uniref:Transcriptional regulator, ArsR family n=1 Tax=Hyphomicrobium denitrificans (strain ATCC 51888 / DSM 1869 / NCIMB 11706 / TK 0415) TaxID=582899 RepID=D8JT35_HYPDA|nr:MULTISPECIES: metalloregulator ArsR/SmtB family transcription factor [Hyphomicrobium]MBN9282518.1 winged helix-turn-helix transcriptional regulator [Hyphomicrobium denitrificans]ADJ22520.1 transcriptional regulator, ArsR family [Hyphomicrobium denitrificans ATCC 51888]MBN9290078.1 winged helix-turn-helix transcriptional regulator [Hyphomicrobium denitrificans]MBN9354785.1 winged helix-turn-helix transcriptional regulator [Hyphomicrobium denitrificans]CEJ86348.1 putative transcriptional regu